MTTCMYGCAWVCMGVCIVQVIFLGKFGKIFHLNFEVFFFGGGAKIPIWMVHPKKKKKSLPVPPPFSFSSSSSFSSLRCCVLFCSILLCCRWCWPLLVARHSSLSFAGKKLSGCRTFLLLFLLLLLLLLLPWLLLLLSRKLQLPLRSTDLQGFVWSSPL